MTAYLRYHPVLADIDLEVGSVRPGRLLVVGESVPNSVVIAESSRRCSVGEVQLPTGIYIFADDSQVEALIVTQGRPPAQPTRIDWTEEPHALLSAYDWMGAWWDEADPILSLIHISEPTRPY